MSKKALGLKFMPLGQITWSWTNIWYCTTPLGLYRWSWTIDEVITPLVQMCTPLVFRCIGN